MCIQIYNIYIEREREIERYNVYVWVPAVVVLRVQA